MSSAWLTVSPAAPGSGQRLRLFCFHHAGGAASIFTGWRAALAPAVEVLPVQLPGREARVREPVPADLATLIADLDAGLEPAMRVPFALYGHSLGAAVAYGLVQRRAERGAPAPVGFLAGGCRAPHRPAALNSAHELPDEDLIAALLRIDGLSADLLRYPQWLRAATDLVRSDLRMAATARHPYRDRLPCPVRVFHGTDDPLVSDVDAEAWREHTTADFRLHRVRGGHLFIRESRPAFLQLLAGELAALAERAERTGLTELVRPARSGL